MNTLHQYIVGIMLIFSSSIQCEVDRNDLAFLDENLRALTKKVKPKPSSSTPPTLSIGGVTLGTTTMSPALAAATAKAANAAVGQDPGIADSEWD